MAYFIVTAVATATVTERWRVKERNAAQAAERFEENEGIEFIDQDVDDERDREVTNVEKEQ